MNSSNFEVNREKTCPFLLRVFFKENDYNSLDEIGTGNFPSNRELHIYTWMDASLRELTILIKDAVEIAKKKDAILNFSLVFPDSKGKLQRKELGSIHAYKKSQDDSKTLNQLRLTVGDHLDININTTGGNKSNYRERERD